MLEQLIASKIDQSPGANILSLIEAYQIAYLKRYPKGAVLYRQGTPADYIFVVKKGSIKRLCISPEGKVHTYEFLGAGRMVGAAAYFLGGEHETTAQAMEATDVFLIPTGDFERLLFNDPFLSMAVIKELAQTVRSLTSKVRELSFLDVLQRLMHSLFRLADEHGMVTENGVKIDLDLTHEELAELITANRTTITAHLSKLKRQGFLSKEGRRLVILPPEQIKILKGLSQAVVDGDEKGAVKWANVAVEERLDPFRAMNALTSGIQQVDAGFVNGDLSLPDVVMAAFAMKSAMPILENEIKRMGKKTDGFGTVVIGTVYGDVHDIGKTMLATLLIARGFNVVDLGVDVTAEKFVEAVRKHAPKIVAMSALMTSTCYAQGKIIRLLEEQGLRDNVYVLVGGGALTLELAEQMGADGYDSTAHGAVELIDRLTG